MRDPRVVEPETAPEASAAPAIADAGTRAGRRARRLILATVVSVGASVLATALAMLVSRRVHGAPDAEQASRQGRPSTTSTINVNWGFALFGTNVMAGRRRRWGGRLLGRRRSWRLR